VDVVVLRVVLVVVVNDVVGEAESVSVLVIVVESVSVLVTVAESMGVAVVVAAAGQ
jgi:hypothetical protein